MLALWPSVAGPQGGKRGIAGDADMGSEPQNADTRPSLRARRTANRRWLRRHGGTLALSVAIGASLFWLLEAGALPVVPNAAAFERVRWWTLPAYAGIWLVVIVLRCGRWFWLLRPIHPVPMRRVLRISFIYIGAVTVLPFRLGELVRPVLVREDGKVPFWAATGTVAAERIVDGVVASLFLLVGLLVAVPQDPLPDHIGALPIPVAAVRVSAYVMLGVFGAAFVTMAIFCWARDWAQRVTRRAVGAVSPRLATWLSGTLGQLADGLRFLHATGDGLRFLLGTLAYWGLHAFGIGFLLWGVGLDSITYAQACAVMGVLCLGLALPNAPGFFGAFQIATYAGLALYFPESEVVTVGSAGVFLLYAIETSVPLLLGGITLLVSHTSLGRVLTAGDRLESAQVE